MKSRQAKKQAKNAPQQPSLTVQSAWDFICSQVDFGSTHLILDTLGSYQKEVGTVYAKPALITTKFGMVPYEYKKLVETSNDVRR